MQPEHPLDREREDIRRIEDELFGSGEAVLDRVKEVATAILDRMRRLSVSPPEAPVAPVQSVGASASPSMSCK
jgi:hypothetical protein